MSTTAPTTTPQTTAPAPTPAPAPAQPAAPAQPETVRYNPRYADGNLETKYLAEQTDLDNLEDSNLYLNYQSCTEDGNHHSHYNLRTSFNNKEKGLNFWFADAKAKVKGKDSSWAARAILSPNAYFMANYLRHFGHGVSVKLGAETEVGKTTRHFLKIRKHIDTHRLTLFVSGNSCGAPSEYVDTVSFIPKLIFKFKDAAHPVKKVKAGLQFDVSVNGKEIHPKDDVKLFTNINLKEGEFCGHTYLGKDLAFDSDLSFYHRLNKHFGVYLSYVGSLRRFDGLKTAGFQVKVPEIGKVRTSINSHYILKNSFIYNVHPFASLVQYTHFNVKERSDLHFGLGLTFGN